MKDALIKVFIFLAASGAGLLLLHLFTILLNQIGAFPKLDTFPQADKFITFYFAGEMFIWILATLISVTAFFYEGPKEKWFIAAPIYAPLIYAIGVFTYFVA